MHAPCYDRAVMTQPPRKRPGKTRRPSGPKGRPADRARTPEKAPAHARGDHGDARAPRAASKRRDSRVAGSRPTPHRSRTHAPPDVDKLLARQPWEALRKPLQRAGADAGAVETLRRYARLLIDWNRTHSNLVSHNDETRIVERHILESVAPAHLLKESKCARWIDFGSGGGLPAIPLAIEGVGERWTLVESRRTKTLFIRKSLQEISLDHIETVNDRVENFILDPARLGSFDGFTSRATLRLGPTLEFAARLVGPGGSAFLWKGSGVEREMEEETAWRGEWTFSNSTPVGLGPNVVTRFIRK